MADFFDYIGPSRFQKSPPTQLMTNVNARPPGYVYYPKGRPHYGQAQHQGRQWPAYTLTKDHGQANRHAKALIKKKAPSRELESTDSNWVIASEPKQSYTGTGQHQYRPKYDRQLSSGGTGQRSRGEDSKLRNDGIMGKFDTQPLRRSQSIPDYLNDSSLDELDIGGMSFSKLGKKERVKNEHETIHRGERIRIQVPAYDIDDDALSDISSDDEDDIYDRIQHAMRPFQKGNLVKNRFQSEPTLYNAQDFAPKYTTTQRPNRSKETTNIFPAQCSTLLPARRKPPASSDGRYPESDEGETRTVVMTSGKNGYGFSLYCVKETEADAKLYSTHGRPTYPRFAKVSEGSIAYRAGIRIFDVVLEINNENVLNSSTERSQHLIQIGGEILSMKIRTHRHRKESEADCRQIELKKNTPQQTEFTISSKIDETTKKSDSLTQSATDKFLKNDSRLSRFKSEPSLFFESPNSSHTSSSNPNFTTDSSENLLSRDVIQIKQDNSSIYDELYDVDLPRTNHDVTDTASLQLDFKSKRFDEKSLTDDGFSMQSAPDGIFIGGSLSDNGRIGKHGKTARPSIIPAPIFDLNAVPMDKNYKSTSANDQSMRSVAQEISARDNVVLFSDFADSHGHSANTLASQFSRDSAYGTVSSKASTESDISKLIAFQYLVNGSPSGGATATNSSGQKLTPIANSEGESDALMLALESVQNDATLSDKNDASVNAAEASKQLTRKSSVPPPVASKPKSSVGGKSSVSISTESVTPIERKLLPSYTAQQKLKASSHLDSCTILQHHAKFSESRSFGSSGSQPFLIHGKEHGNGEQFDRLGSAESAESNTIDNIYENLDDYDANESNVFHDPQPDRDRCTNLVKTNVLRGSNSSDKNGEPDFLRQAEKMRNRFLLLKTEAATLDRTEVARIPNTSVGYHARDDAKSPPVSRNRGDTGSSSSGKRSGRIWPDSAPGEDFQQKPLGVLRTQVSNPAIAQLAKIMAAGGAQRGGNTGASKESEGFALQVDVHDVAGVTQDSSATERANHEASVDEKNVRSDASKSTPPFALLTSPKSIQQLHDTSSKLSPRNPAKGNVQSSSNLNSVTPGISSPSNLRSPTTGNAKFKKLPPPPPVTPKSKTFQFPSSPISGTPSDFTDLPSPLELQSPISSGRPCLPSGVISSPDSLVQSPGFVKQAKLNAFQHNSRSRVEVPSPMRLAQSSKSPGKQSNPRTSSTPPTSHIKAPFKDAHEKVDNFTVNTPPVLPDFIPPSPASPLESGSTLADLPNLIPAPHDIFPSLLSTQHKQPNPSSIMAPLPSANVSLYSPDNSQMSTTNSAPQHLEQVVSNLEEVVTESRKSFLKNPGRQLDNTTTPAKFSKTQRISKSKSETELRKMRLSMTTLNQIDLNPSSVVPPKEFDNSSGDISKSAILNEHHNNVQTTNQDISSEGRGFVMKSVADWSAADVGEWLHHHSLGEHTKKFVEDSIDGSKLVKLDRRRLIELGVTSMEQRRKVEFSVRKLVASK